MDKEMLINTVQGQECRIAIVSGAGLEELYVERASTASRVGNIYKGRITNVEAAIQAAFVDFGLTKNGFLHISDVTPNYFPKGNKGPEQVGRKQSHRTRPPIQECLHRGKEVVVQMTKEGIGTKGPTLTTYLSIPGRLVVMMPGMSRLGVSRKVEDEDARAKARSALGELKLPSDMGFIIRTIGVDRPKRELQRDLNYLLRLWKAVKQRIRTSHAPAEIYQESDLVTRTTRDVYNSDIKRIICDNEAVARKIKEFLSVAVPRSKHSIELYTGKDGLFYEYGLEDEIERINSRRVELRSGGSLVIDQTEALVAIDVNSGRFRQHSDAETTALKINEQAAEEIVRQLRLRDLGGVIIIDFIDMRDERNCRAVEKTLRDALRRDRAKTKVLRMSAFGIVELTRQRLGPSLKQSIFDRCECCDGMGVVKSPETLSLMAIRNIQRGCAIDDVASIEAAVRPEVAHHLLNRQRKQINQLENDTGKSIIIRADMDLGSDDWKIICTNRRGSAVAWEPTGPSQPRKHKVATIDVDELPAPPKAEAAPETGAVTAADAAEPEGPSAEGPVSDDELGLGPDVEPEADEEDEEEGRADVDEQGEQGEAPSEEQQAAAKKTRRGRRGGRKHRRKREGEAAPAAETVSVTPIDGDVAAATAAAQAIVAAEEGGNANAPEPPAPPATETGPPGLPPAEGQTAQAKRLSRSQRRAARRRAALQAQRAAQKAAGGAPARPAHEPPKPQDQAPPPLAEAAQPPVAPPADTETPPAAKKAARRRRRKKKNSQPAEAPPQAEDQSQ